jgi:hypothetical protein
MDARRHHVGVDGVAEIDVDRFVEIEVKRFRIFRQAVGPLSRARLLIGGGTGNSIAQGDRNCGACSALESAIHAQVPAERRLKHFVAPCGTGHEGHHKPPSLIDAMTSTRRGSRQRNVALIQRTALAALPIPDLDHRRRQRRDKGDPSVRLRPIRQTFQS